MTACRWLSELILFRARDLVPAASCQGRFLSAKASVVGGVVMMEETYQEDGTVDKEDKD